MKETLTGEQARTVVRGLGEITMPYDSIKREEIANKGAESATAGEVGKKPKKPPQED